jgi:hypothetical protein
MSVAKGLKFKGQNQNREKKFCSAEPEPRQNGTMLHHCLQAQSARRGLLDISTALCFYKRLKTSLHKPRGNLLENLFSQKCAFKNNLQLLYKKFLSQTNTIPKNGILLSKMAHFQES